MLKKQVTYKDFDGNEVTETLYFHLSKADMVEMEMSADEGFGEQLKGIVASEKPSDLFRIFKKIVMDAYGVRSEDGKRFIKSPEQSLEFTQTEAYSALVMNFISDDQAAMEFVRGILPLDMLPEVDKEIKELMKTQEEAAKQETTTQETPPAPTQ